MEEKIPSTLITSPDVALSRKKGQEINDLELDNFLSHYHQLEKVVSSVRGDTKEGKIQNDYNTAREKITTKHDGILDALGIELNPATPSKEAMKSGDEQKFYYPEMRIDIYDGNKFLHYLKTLRSGSLSLPQKDFLITTITSLHKQARDEYDPLNPDDHFFEFFRSLEDIIEIYSHFYFSKDLHTGADLKINSVIFPDLKEYLHTYKNGYLKELLLAKRAGLPISSFSSSIEGGEATHVPFRQYDLVNNFLRDMYDKETQSLNHDFLDKGITLLRKMQENKNAASLSYELVQNIMNLLNYIQDHPKLVDASKEVLRDVKDYKRVLEEIAQSIRFHKT